MSNQTSRTTTGNTSADLKSGCFAAVQVSKLRWIVGVGTVHDGRVTTVLPALGNAVQVAEHTAAGFGAVRFSDRIRGDDAWTLTRAIGGGRHSLKRIRVESERLFPRPVRTNPEYLSGDMQRIVAKELLRDAVGRKIFCPGMSDGGGRCGNALNASTAVNVMSGRVSTVVCAPCFEETLARAVREGIAVPTDVIDGRDLY